MNQQENIRAEYIEVSNDLRAGVTICWEAFKTYFTVVGLLFATLGFVHDQTVASDATGKWVVSFLIALVGVVVTVWAVPAIKRITAYQRVLLERGVELDGILETQLMRRSSALFNDGKAGHDDLTMRVFSAFGWAWFGALVFFGIMIFRSLGE